MAQRSGTGEQSANEILGFNAFPYPKPTSLMRSLLAQATRPGDTVLDFFAGSATTGHAVLALNAHDGGKRRFILCSSAESTAKEADKNLCRDICAERIRRVITANGYDESFAYLQLDKYEAADVAFETTPEHAQLLISLRETASVPVDMRPDKFHVIAKSGDWLIVLCWQATPEVVDLLATLPATYGVSGLAVFCPRPNGLKALLEARGVQVNAYSINDAMLNGQNSGKPHSITPRKDSLSGTRANAVTAPSFDSEGSLV